MLTCFARLLLGPPILAASVAIGGGDPPAARLESEKPADAAARKQTAAEGPGLLIVDEAPEPLVPSKPRTEADRDRVEALALFAAARMHHQRQDYAAALRFYQRSLRRDPEAEPVARAIISLAAKLKRYAQAARYALRAPESKEADPWLLQRLGAYMDKQGDWPRALALYERAMAVRAGGKETGFDVLLHREMGRLYFLVGSNVKAADCFARAMHALEHPKKYGIDKKQKEMLLGAPGEAYNLFGECFLAAGRPKKAMAAFEKAHTVAPNKGLLEFNLARVHAHRGKPAMALAGLQACFAEKLTGAGIAPYQLLAKVLEDLDNQDELIGRLEKLHRDDPDNVPLGYFLAGQYRQAKQFEKAEPLYLALVKKTPTLTGYRALIDIYRKTEQPEALLAILGEAAEKVGVLDTLGAEAQAVSSDAGLMRKLIEIARKKVKADPEKFGHGMRLAVALLALESKQFQTAGEFFDLAIKVRPKSAAELLLVWGMGLLLEERSAEAAKVFQRAIDEKVAPPGNPAFHFYLAGALAMDDRTDEALAAARKAAELKKDMPRFASRVAWVLYRAKRYDKAIKAYRELIDKFDAGRTSTEDRRVLRDARLAISNLYVLKDDLDEAEEWVEQVLDEFPDDVGAANDLGYLWADQNKHLGRSLRMIQHAVDAEPENEAYRDSLGWVYFRLGQYKKAVAELEKAVADAQKDNGGPDAVILDHLGDAYSKLKQTKKAKDAWRRAMKMFQKEEEPQKAKTVNQKIKMTND